MIRRPPRSTLFPTRRSSDLASFTQVLTGLVVPADLTVGALTIPAGCPIDALLTAPAASCGGNRDRKSTRLNSSHPSISYAVFCLKKKTTATLLPNLHYV